jgi:Flp pilus assembly protein TadB
MADVNDILRKYGSKIETQINTTNIAKGNYSQSYIRFKQEMAPSLSNYEKWCRSLGNVLKLNVAEKDRIKIKRQLDISHLDIEPAQALTLSVMSFVLTFFIGLVISVAVMLINGSVDSFPFLFFILMLVFSVFMFYFVNGYPARLANRWRLKASSQMVPAILYIVVYMRHTPNLEKAVGFAAEHLQYPLALDFKKVFYDVEVGKFSTIKDSLDNYLETWRDYSIEFIEAFHLIESSLFEPDDQRRISILEKALQVVLDGVYDKMLKFTHDVRSPLNNVYMLGVVLPTLGVVLIPLASAMIGGLIKTVHVFILFDLIIPFLVFYMTDNIMLLRPGGHGDTELLERNPLYYKYKSKKPYAKAFLAAFPLFLIGIIPLIFGYAPESVLAALGLQKDYTFAQLGMGFLGNEQIFGFISSSGSVTGPFGIGALMLSMLIPISIALFFSMAFKEKTRELIIEREKTKQLELEFNNSLFQLGNRIGNGTPPEIAFGNVAESSKGLKTEDFFRKVNYNIRQGGMGVESAIFDKNRGALIYYPSELISTSMKILVESAKKGLKIAALSLMSISEYVKNIDKINQRLKDMLAEVVSDMKSNMTFLAPLLLGVVVGLSAMITSILNKLNISELGSAEAAGISNLQSFLNIFDLTKMIPPYYLQIIIGIYIIEIIFILTNTLVTIDSGENRLERTYNAGKNFARGIFLYFIVATVAVLSLFLLASLVLGNII